MQPNLKTSLIEYQYDALNRLVASTPSTQDATQRFYLKDHLITEIQGTAQRSIMQHGDQLLAQQQRQGGTLETGLLATNQLRSVLNVLDKNRPNPLAYTPYGHRPLSNGLLSLLGFNGERPDPVMGWYLLGTGYHRPFNPVLGCFVCPDSWSPFGKGGLNAYAYCVGDPLNRSDAMGHSWVFVKGVMRSRGLIKSNMQGTENAYFTITSSSVMPVRPRQFRNPLADTTHPYAKTPAWANQDQSAFAVTESQSTHNLRSAISQETLSAVPDVPNVPTQTRPRTRRMGVSYQNGELDELARMHGGGRSINSTSGIRSPSNNYEMISDPPPPYSAPLPPPSYESEALPTYQQSTANHRWLSDLSSRQNQIRHVS